MNKSELIDIVAEKTGFTKKDMKCAVEAILETITETLAKRDVVNFIGFGTFSTANRAARTSKVPNTDREVQVPATVVAKFKVGKTLKDTLKN